MLAGYIFGDSNYYAIFLFLAENATSCLSLLYYGLSKDYADRLHI